MKSLFIIGNGFDLAHGLKTKYEDFHEYLIKKYNISNNNLFCPIPESILDHHGNVCRNDEVAAFLNNLIEQVNGGEWSDLESILGNLDYGDYLDDDGLYEEDDDHPYDKVYRNQDNASNIAEAVIQIKNYFSEWVNTIEIGKVSPLSAFKNLINVNSDLFLTFNYTETLESLYHVKNICHIHGKKGGNLLFGHGNDTDYTDYYMEKHIGSENALVELQIALRKDTNCAIKNNQDFFNKLTSSVGKIYTYGFSFSKVDQIYIQTICDKLRTKNIVWFLNDYDCGQHNIYKDIIYSCGFKGQFSTYIIK